jgi:bifunctional UDP-N-acetylglucosamine pyrophosphorylase / glucosamine-1-phosphate N-acetyltransferase
MSTRAIVLAAGKGSRMKSGMPKVLHEVAGMPLVSWVVGAVIAAGADDVLVVVGPDGEAVAAALPDVVRAVVQEGQRGTGEAAQVAVHALGADADDTVLVVPGDSPLLTVGTLRAIVDARRASSAGCSMLTARLHDPTGYGRVVRDGDAVVRIVEEADADERTRSISEVAASTYAFRAGALAEALASLGDANAQGELYLTDAVEALVGAGVVTVTAADADEVLGVNTQEQLATVRGIMRRRINSALMAGGVSMPDPGRVYVDAGVTVAEGAAIYPGTHLEGATTVGAGAQVGPDAFVVDSDLGEGSRVWYSVVRGASIGTGVDVGPFASIRPGTVMHEGSKAGTFVEVKASVVGRGSKVPHLTYLGDATVGEETNIGAGTVTCNYDGFEKHETHIGDRVFIGSDTMLVAPVTVGDDAITGAGSVITRDVPAGSLAVERSPQKEIPGYAERRAKLAEAEGE